MPIVLTNSLVVELKRHCELYEYGMQSLVFAAILYSSNTFKIKCVFNSRPGNHG